MPPSIWAFWGILRQFRGPSTLWCHRFIVLVVQLKWSAVHCNTYVPVIAWYRFIQLVRHVYHISAIKLRGYYLFHHMIYYSYYLRASANEGCHLLHSAWTLIWGTACRQQLTSHRLGPGNMRALAKHEWLVPIQYSNKMLYQHAIRCHRQQV